MVEFRCTFNNHLDASWFTYNFVPTTAITNEVGQEKESSAVFSTGPTTGSEYIRASQSKSRLLKGQCQKQVYSSETEKRGESIVRSIEV